MVGWAIDHEKYNRMLDEYYEIHGWNKETSYPCREVLENLGLKNVADDLEKINKLGYCP
jgi:aldehyde:ferredoxin oxidoreductase